MPQGLLNSARDISSRKKLASIMPLPFTAKELPTFTKTDLIQRLSSKDSAEFWSEDSRELSALLGGDDRWGGVNPGDRRAIYTLIMATKPKTVLEIGTHIGASTLHLAKALERSGSGGHITTVDILNVNAENGPWRDIGMTHCPLDYLKKLRLSDSVTFIAQKSAAFLKDCTEKFDFIFLDGDHGADTVYIEVSAALAKLNKGGLILLHDYYPNGEALFPDGSIIYGPYRAMERIAKENSDITTINLSPLPWESKQGSVNTSLTIISRK